MKDTFLHLSIDPRTPVNQPAIAEALKGIQYTEYFTGNYVIQTDLAPEALKTRLNTALGNAQCLIFAVHRDQFEDALMPMGVTNWIEGRNAA